MSDLLNQFIRFGVLFLLLAFNVVAFGEPVKNEGYTIAFFFDSTGSTSIVVTSETAISTNFTDNLVRKHGIIETSGTARLSISNHVRGRVFWVGQLRSVTDLPHIIRGDTQRGVVEAPDFKVAWKDGTLCLSLSGSESFRDDNSTTSGTADCQFITLVSETGFTEAIGGTISEDRRVCRIPRDASFRVKLRLE